MRLIIVRHGQTVQNAKQIIQGHMHGKLSKLGKAQVNKLAEELKNEKIDVILSSDLGRTKETTRAIAKYHDVPVLYLSELRERNHGIFEGKHADKYRKARDASGKPYLLFKPKNGESITEVIKRMRKFSRRIGPLHKNDTVLLVTHGGVIKALAHIYLKLPPHVMHKIHTVNAGVLVLEVKNSGGRAKLVRGEIFKPIAPGAQKINLWRPSS